MNDFTFDPRAWFLEEQASAVFLSMNREGVILHANRFALEYLGHALVGARFHDVLVDFHKTFDLGVAMQAADSVVPLNVNRPGALPQTLLFRFLERDGVVYAFGEADVRETERLRKTLVESNMEFSNLTRELHKANAELKRLGELKNHFLGMAAHDLRSPLSGIMGMCQLLQEEPCLQEEDRESLRMMEGSSQFMLSLIDDLLDYSRLESGCLEITPIPLDLEAEVRFCIAQTKPAAEAKDICLECHLLEPLPYAVSLDKNKIMQTVNNLLSNAVKFSPSGTTVQVELFMSGDNVALAVTDEGPGISEEDRGRIFEPFTRGGAKPTGGERSSGLGLHIVRRIVLAHGGNIWLDNVPGKGARFVVTLPGKRDNQQRKDS